jgi:uncharacterized protein (DUF1330 family)
MPAYVIATVRDARDPEALAEYRRRNTDVVAAHGGRFLARGGEQVILEGDPRTERVVVMEFPDLDAARAWYADPDYEAVKPLRQGASETDIVAVAGVE